MSDDAVDGDEGRCSGMIQWTEEVKAPAGPITLEEFSAFVRAQRRVDALETRLATLERTFPSRLRRRLTSRGS